MNRVVISGIGVVSPLGVGFRETWKALLAGHSAVRRIQHYDPASLRTSLGAEILEFDAKPAVRSRKSLRLMTRANQLAHVAVRHAADEAGIDPAYADNDRVGVFLASENQIADPSHVLDATVDAREEDGSIDMARLGKAAADMYPLFFVEGLPSAEMFFLSDEYGFAGPSAFGSGSADAGVSAIGNAYRAIARGDTEIAVAGAFDDAVSWWGMSKMDRLGLLTDRTDAEAVRPYDRDSSGTVLGEGACMVLLESYSSATRRGVRPYAEIVGFGGGWNPVTPGEFWGDGTGLGNAVRSALREAAVAGGDIGYVAADGSAVARADAAEARGLRAGLGAGADSVMASSVQPAVGQLLSATGALNVALAAAALREGAVPPTLNLDIVAADCDLDWVPGSARDLTSDYSVAIGRGLSGQSAALALKRI
ncbi:beta-ketoacyl-[acyl-carrier-protein] synthase family protein [Nocardia bovistercoris]|uniref:Beta-ketoacyl-[acyl-carrier-protein] synthase family protein n=1 Tax=Nocardia bovistercoris TaxID=2785916 RepID=A0A931N198_9NOCA|nr:beta-ketoacyl synthase N-terminal-like domain-containing protein [Nocardia bovistercoris]MBH0775477.1 beta-ketoacyl-[acyl-carrier-protein] synthase family protein [Nocardia bovistercoris]